MEEIIEELGKIVENSNSKQTEQMSSILAEFRLEIKKQGNVPPPVIKLNTGEISAEIKAHLSGLNIKVDDSNLISALKQELKKHDIALEQARTEISNLNSLTHNSIREIREEKNKAVKIRAENLLWGFTSSKSFFLSLSLLGIFIGVGFYFYFQATELELENKKLESQNSAFHERVENLRYSSPKLAKKYFY